MRSKKLTYSSLIAMLLVFILGILSAHAAPSDPFLGAAPSFSAAPKEPVGNNTGDWGVAEQRGAARAALCA